METTFFKKLYHIRALILISCALYVVNRKDVPCTDFQTSRYRQATHSAHDDNRDYRYGGFGTAYSNSCNFLNRRASDLVTNFEHKNMNLAKYCRIILF